MIYVKVRYISESGLGWLTGKGASLSQSLSDAVGDNDLTILGLVRITKAQYDKEIHTNNN